MGKGTMRIRKRLISLIATFSLMTACLIGMGLVKPARAEEVKSIDMYLIGGQSNAAGYSTASGVEGKYSNIMYVGETDKQLNGTNANNKLNSISAYKKYVTVGYGISSDKIGPEFGMAKSFDQYYGGENKAIIFKSAAGGTALRNTSDGWSGVCGNWYPKSMWETGFTPDPSVSPTGVQYKNFVDNFRIVYNTLKDNGYSPKVKGMAWMQGEADLGATSEYIKLIKAFILDVREDIAEITGDDTNLLMPFVIGEIATTFESYGNPLVPPFNKMQREVAAEIDGMYTVPTSDLVIVGKDGVKGTDLYHFNGNDAVTLGERFGEKLLASNSDTLVKLDVTGKNGKAEYRISEDGTKVTVIMKPNKNYKVTTVKVNNSEMLNSVENNELVLDASVEKRFNVTVGFEKKTALDIKVENDVYKGKAEKDVTYEDDKILITVTPNAGYKVKSVTFNDAELTLNPETGMYESEPVTTGGTVKVDYEIENAEENKSGGCGAAATKDVAFAMIAIAGVAFILKRY